MSHLLLRLFTFGRLREQHCATFIAAVNIYFSAISACGDNLCVPFGFLSSIRNNLSPSGPGGHAGRKNVSMLGSNLIRNFGTKILLGAALLAAPAASFAQLSISVGFAPPALPVYVQPEAPGDGYLWTPGYWAYGPAGYFWVPGVWLQPPSFGLLWTPPYWGFEGGQYGFHQGYWGDHIGFYGGVNYGFGYGGHGYDGGYWQGNHFAYNLSVNHFGGGFHPQNTYTRNVTVVNNNYAHTSYSGGPHGVPGQPNAQEQAAMHESHAAMPAAQTQHFQAAAQDRSQLASVNNGRPAMAAARTPEAYHAVAAQHPVTANDRPNNAGNPGRNAAPQPNSRPTAAAAPAAQPRAQVQPQARPQPQAQPEARPQPQVRPQPQAQQPQARPQQEARPQPQARPEPQARPQPQQRSEPAPREAPKEEHPHV